jgi:hypothetical protein
LALQPLRKLFAQRLFSCLRPGRGAHTKPFAEHRVPAEIQSRDRLAVAMSKMWTDALPSDSHPAITVKLSASVARLRSALSFISNRHRAWNPLQSF